MATTETPEAIAAAWLADKPSPVHLRSLVRATATGSNGTQVPAILSYGPHYVAAYKDANGTIMLNVTDYCPSDAERSAAGWNSRNLYRRPKFSPTTRRHVHAIAAALDDAGYAPVAGVKRIGPNYHDFQLYSNVYCEHCEDEAISPGRRFCSDACKAEDRAEFAEVRAQDAYDRGDFVDDLSDALSGF